MGYGQGMDYLFEGIGLDVICKRAADREAAVQEYMQEYMQGIWAKKSEDMRAALVTADPRKAIYNIFGRPVVFLRYELVKPTAEEVKAQKPGAKKLRSVRRKVMGPTPEEKYLGTVTVQEFVKG